MSADPLKAGHTPTPWRLMPEALGSIVNADGTVVVAQAMQTRAVRTASDHDERKANAAFIVRACNVHDKLVEALRKYAHELCEGWCKGNGGHFDDCGGCPARAALAAAKEQQT